MKQINRFHSVKFSQNVWLVAFFGLFLSASTQMLYSHLALFLKFELGTSQTTIADIDGFVEFTSYLVRIFSGAISDYLYNRKLLLVVGATIALLVKPFFALAHSVSTVVFAEIVERVGSGIQASPRDALIADLSSPSQLGTTYGFCKAMKTTGGILGSVVAITIVWFFDNSYNFLFIFAAIPAFLALFCAIKIIAPTQMTSDPKKFDNPFKRKYLKSLDRNFWTLILLAVMCEFGHFTESLLTVRCPQFIPVTFSGITSVFSAFGQIIFAYFMGIAADKYDKLYLLKISLTLILISYTALCLTSSVWLFLPIISVLCGQFVAMQLLFLAMINAHVNPKLRGTAIGIFYFVIGSAYFTSSMICGWLSDTTGYETAFGYTMTMTTIALTFCWKNVKIH